MFKLSTDKSSCSIIITPLARARTLSAGPAWPWQWAQSPGIDQSEASRGEGRPIAGLAEPGSGSGQRRQRESEVTWRQSRSDVGRDRAAPSEISRQEWNMRIASGIPERSVTERVLWCSQWCGSKHGPPVRNDSNDGEMWTSSFIELAADWNWVSNNIKGVLLADATHDGNQSRQL